MKNSTRHAEGDNDQPIISKKLAVGAVLVLAAMAFISLRVHACMDGDKLDDKPQTDEPAHAKDASVHKPKHQPRRDTVQADEPDSSLILSDDDQPTLEEACQEIKDSVTYDEPGAIQDAFRAAENLMPNATNPLEGAHGFLQRMGRACGMSEIQLLNILTKAIEQGDTRTAGFLNDYIVSRCSDEDLRALMTGSKQLYADLGDCETPREKCEKPLQIQGSEACESISWTDEEGKISCLQPHWDNMKKQCGTLPHDTDASFKCSRTASSAYDQRNEQREEDKLTCPDRTAQAMGTDLQRIQSLNAQAVGNKLATLRLTLLDPTSELSEDLLRQYMAELRQFLISKDISPFLESLGLKEADEFLTKYIEEVARALRNRGEPYSAYAGLLEAIWSLREVMHDED